VLNIIPLSKQNGLRTVEENNASPYLSSLPLFLCLYGCKTKNKGRKTGTNAAVTISPVYVFGFRFMFFCFIAGAQWTPTGGSVSVVVSNGNLLVSCGKDGRSVCWNPNSGEVLSELPVSTNWVFDVLWSPRVPAILAAASLAITCAARFAFSGSGPGFLTTIRFGLSTEEKFLFSSFHSPRRGLYNVTKGLRSLRPRHRLL